MYTYTQLNLHRNVSRTRCWFSIWVTAVLPVLAIVQKPVLQVLLVDDLAGRLGALHANGARLQKTHTITSLTCLNAAATARHEM